MNPSVVTLRLAAAMALLWGLFAAPAAAVEAKASTVPEAVSVGVYINQIPELDVKTNTFLADFYVWLRWKGKLDPTRSFEIMNAMDRTNLWKEASFKDASGADKPEELPNGTRYQEFHMQGRFAQPYVLEDYPLDRQQLTLHFEDKLYDTSELRYVADASQSRVRPSVTVPGWIFRGFLAQASDALYNTNFGDPATPSATQHSYPRVSFTMNVERPMSSVVAKTVLPLLIVLLIAFSSLLLKAQNIDARCTLTITALMSAVALHYSDMTELPPTGYLLLLDKIYILSYMLIFAATVLSIGSYRLSDSGRERAAVGVDRSALAGLVALACAGFGLILSWR